MKTVLLVKRLSNSDMSDVVLLSGRIVLPRTIMEQNIGHIVSLGCMKPSAVLRNREQGSKQWPLEVTDDVGRSWTLLLKQWTSNSGTTPRPIFVLERTTECMVANRAVAGHYIQLWTDAVTAGLHISVLTPSQVEQAKTSAWNPALETAFPTFASSVQRLTHVKAGKEFATASHNAEPAGVPFPPQPQNSSSNIRGIRTSYSHGSRSARYDMLHNARTRSPEWVRVSCGIARGDLHVPTMQVTVVHLRDNSCRALSLAEFEQSGGLHCGCSQWQSSVLVEDCGLPLGRWLALWDSNDPDELVTQEIDRQVPAPHAVHAAWENGNSAGRSSCSTYEEGLGGEQQLDAAAAGEVLLSLSSIGTSKQHLAVKLHGSDNCNADGGILPVAEEQASLEIPLAAQTPSKPQPSIATPEEAAALYIRVTEEAAAREEGLESTRDKMTEGRATVHLRDLAHKAQVMRILAALGAYAQHPIA